MAAVGFRILPHVTLMERSRDTSVLCPGVSVGFEPFLQERRANDQKKTWPGLSGLREECFLYKSRFPFLLSQIGGGRVGVNGDSTWPVTG